VCYPLIQPEEYVINGDNVNDVDAIEVLSSKILRRRIDAHMRDLRELVTDQIDQTTVFELAQYVTRIRAIFCF
jgi:hypothetical protein